MGSHRVGHDRSDLAAAAGERIGYPVQYSWVSLVAQLVKNPPAMRETRVRSLEKGKATPSSTLAWRIPWTSPWITKSLTRLSDFHVAVFISKQYCLQ